MSSVFRNFSDTEITFLKGVGPERASVLAKELGIRTFGELLQHYPFRYVDRTRIYKIREITADLPYVQVKGTIRNVEMAGDLRKKRLVAQLEDDTGTLELVWFQGVKWIAPKIKPGTEFIAFGKPSLFNRGYNMAHPELELASEANMAQARKLMPVYSSGKLLEKKGLDSKGIWKIQKELVSRIKGQIPEILPDYILDQHNLISKEEALQIIHQPENAQALARAEWRLKFDELFFLQLRMLRIKGLRKKNYKGILFTEVGHSFNDFYNNHLPFELTGAQKKVLREIRADLNSGHQMNRLLQGDVGSGKTVVALLSMLMALDNGYQSLLMAPTEILANQHFKNLSRLLEPMGVKIGLLTGSTKKSERTLLHDELRKGEMKILVGTHALLEEEVQFHQLGLTVIDEQHKFGVAQRSRLWTKGQTAIKNESGQETGRMVPHVLVMTATPIPRTLAMTLYGDLDVSVIDELPPGRKPIKTVHRYDSARQKVYGFLQDEIRKGRQIYIVYPIIEESKVLDYKNLEEGFKLVRKHFPEPDYSVGMVHGRLKNDVKEAQMRLFAEGKTRILVATTVIEVGVDVPNASVMVIESAERFGLSQLHQLRGRVGRGADESFCILMTGYELGNDARVRMETMVRTSNGFEIAETDLRLRGPGDVAGTQQSGIMDLHIADLSRDANLLQYSRDVAIKVLENDPLLEKPENMILNQELERIRKAKPYWGRIS